MNDHTTLLEICTASVDDAIVAEQAGAQRIELNTALPLGGLSPTPAMVKQTLQQISIPVITMARPRESGFCYSGNEFTTLRDDARWMLDAGVHGIAFGVLTEAGEIDEARCRQMVETIGPDRDAVFHRAFDLVTDPVAALQTLIECGVNRVMTSGGQVTAWQGRQQIKQMVDLAVDEVIEILPAGGIRADHASQLIQFTAVTQIHCGLGKAALDRSYVPGKDGSAGNDQVNFYGMPPENPAQFRQSCQSSIQEMRRVLDQGQT